MANYTTIKHQQDGHLRTASKPDKTINEPYFAVYQNQLHEVLGASPELTIGLEDDKALFHEAGVFFSGEAEDRLFVTSGQIITNGVKDIQISLLTRAKDSTAWTRQDIADGEAVMANGAVNCPDMKSLLICAQGSKHHIGGLVRMNIDEPYETELVLTHYHGRQFNSVNDVVYASDGSIWFTDPDYGYEQGFRPKPELPKQLYRYDPTTQDLRAMADEQSKPNGLCFSPDEQTLYVTDTDHIHGDGNIDLARASHIYAYTVKYFHGSPFLTERRLFAMADTGWPDGIKCDTQGRVYSGCSDGVNIWSPNGTLLGKIVVPGGCANFCFGRPGELFILNETRFWVATLSSEIRGALLDGKN